MLQALRTLTSRPDAREAAVPMLVFAIGWAMADHFFAVRLDNHYDLIQVVWCGYSVQCVLTVAAWGWRDPALLWRTRKPLHQAGRSLLMVVMPSCFLVSLSGGTSPELAWAIFWTAPLMAMAIAWAGLGERARAFQWGLAVAGCIGATMIWGPPAPESLGQVLWPAAMALSFALYVVLTRGLRDESPVTNLFYTAAGVVFALAPFVPSVWTWPSANDALTLAGFGACGWASLLALDIAARRAEVAGWALSMLLQVCFVAVIACVGEGRLPSPPVLVGMGVVLACVVGAGLLGARHSRRSGRVPRSAGVAPLPIRAPWSHSR